MKKLLLLLLLIPNFVLAENVLYCKDEIATGFIQENERYRTSNFVLKRHTIKFNDDYTVLNIGEDQMTCKRPHSYYPQYIVCIDSYVSDRFSYNQNTKRYVMTNQSLAGYTLNGGNTETMRGGSCEKF